MMAEMMGSAQILRLMLMLVSRYNARHAAQSRWRAWLVLAYGVRTTLTLASTALLSM